MPHFVDPRSEPVPSELKRGVRTTLEYEAIEPLIRACREGRLYDIERWIAQGQPLQLADPAMSPRRRNRTALSVALDQKCHALVLLLLCNGYDPDLESICPLDTALEARRLDLVDLLLVWGADPTRVDLYSLFGSYNSDLFERFYNLGVNLTRRHTLARTLADHTSNKPLFGFAKRHRDADPAIERDLNMALTHHAYEGNEKGTLLCLWAGADPHATSDYLSPYEMDDEDEDWDDDDTASSYTALQAACSTGHADLVKRFGPDPERDNFEALFRAASNPETVDVLARYALPKDMLPVVEQRVQMAGWAYRKEKHAAALQRLFEHGARLESASAGSLRDIRRHLLRLRDFEFCEFVLALSTEGACSPEIRHELNRTPAFERRLVATRLLPEPGARNWHLRREAGQLTQVLLAFRPNSAEARRVAARALRA